MSCVICLDRVFEQHGKEQCYLPCCKNLIHQQCVVHYLMSAQSILCPICRHVYEYVDAILTKGQFIDSVETILDTENIKKDWLQRANDILKNNFKVGDHKETILVVEYLEVEDTRSESFSPYSFLRNTYVQFVMLVVWIIFILCASFVATRHE